jgi:integrase
MAKHVLHRLTYTQVKTTTKDLCDGGGLWVQYSKKYETRHWLLKFTWAGKPDQMGLGSVLMVSLAEARRTAAKYRALLRDGINPREARDEASEELKAAAAKPRTMFQPTFEAYVEVHRGSWRSAKHLAQWKGSLKHTGAINNLDVAAIDTPHVLKVLEPLWSEKTETASRIRARIEAVLDYATATKARVGDNPARWEALKDLLPAPSKIAKVEHHAALPYADVPEFMTKLRSRSGVSARALEFTILTAARVGEVLGARREEVDLEAGVWTVPGERMKAGKPHEVPLSGRAIEILEAEMRRDVEIVFPGLRGELSDQSLRDLLKALGASCTLHGFRSSFRDWCGDQTNFPREVAEAALAHKVGDGTEQAYRRASAIEKRRRLMNAWSSYCGRKPAAIGESKVIDIREAARGARIMVAS